MFNTSKSGYTTRTLKPGDPNWSFTTNGITLSPRAGFEINCHCPREYRLIIAECINNGWLTPIANIKESELTFDILTEGN